MRLSDFTLYFRSALYAISGNEWDIDLSVIAGHFKYTAIQLHLLEIQLYIQIFRPLDVSHLGTILMNQHCILLFQKGFFGDMLRG